MVSDVTGTTVQAQNLKFVYDLPAGSNVTTVPCPTNPVAQQPCDPGKPISDAQRKYEEAAKKSDRLNKFAEKNNMTYFEDHCWKD